MAWIESAFCIDGRRIVVAVKRLGEEEAATLAASLAWFASVAETPGATLDATGWPALLQRIMAEYVSLFVDNETLGRLDELWTPLCSGALRAFVRVNEMDPALARQLGMPAARLS